MTVKELKRSEAMNIDMEKRYCKNCGELIEAEEFLRNQNAIYCKHCRLTLFDGPDLYDYTNKWSVLV